jgi:hypothetical protein
MRLTGTRQGRAEDGVSTNVRGGSRGSVATSSKRDPRCAKPMTPGPAAPAIRRMHRKRTARMKLRPLLAALACGGALLAFAPNASAKRPTHVVCWFLAHRGLNGWHERVRPSGGCALHRAHHGQGSWIYLAGHTRWSRWSPRRATGRVRYHSGAKLKITLYRPREGWTPKGKVNYFSRLRFRSGADRTWRLDVPQHKHISFH